MLSGQPGLPPLRHVAALSAALVLMADHELSASALAARVASSAWADPYRVVLAGLGPLGGALHGGASLQISAMLDEFDSTDTAFATLQRGSRPAQFPASGTASTATAIHVPSTYSSASQPLRLSLPAPSGSTRS